jgi:hypothetical protein
MNLLRHLNLRRAVLPTAAVLGALPLLWLVRRAPVALPPLLAVDALGAYFVFVTLCVVAVLLRDEHHVGEAWRAFGAAALLIAAYLTALTPVVIITYLAAALLTTERRARAFALISAAALAVGYGALALRGAVRYDVPAAGTALDGFVFWFVLLAAAAPLLPLAVARGREAGEGRPGLGLARAALDIAWLYPLARLYSLGPWNEGWSFATLLLGGAAALWCSLAALTRAGGSTTARLVALSHLGLALAGFGLGTGAGIAAGCYGLIAYLLLMASAAAPERAVPSAVEGDAPEFDTLTSHAAAQLRRVAPWLLTPAVPFSAPFVACWMLLGAAVAGGVSLLGAVAWLVALLGAVAGAIRLIGGSGRETLGGLVSLLLGILAPALVLALIQPVIEQLQGGLSVYGDVNIWPWVGLASVDSSRRGVTALPSVAVAALMLVLCALVYLVVRLREEGQETGPGGSSGSGDASRPEEDGAVEPGGALPGSRARAILSLLRAEVPWLGARPRREEHPGDDR